MVQMTKAEEKVVRYANLEKWDYEKILFFVNWEIPFKMFDSLQGDSAKEKTDYIINKFKPKMETKTKVTVLGGEPKKELKRIEFIKGMMGDTSWNNNVGYAPSEYKEIILLEKGYGYINGEYYDLMYCIAYDNKPNCLMYGKFNDGIV